MKQFKSFLTATTLAAAFMAQGTLAKAQEDNATTRAIDHWQFELNTGLTIGGTTNESHFCATAGWRFNRKNVLGLGLGYQIVEDYIDDPYGLNNGHVPFLPVYVDYAHYIPFRHHQNHSFLFGADGGVGYYPDKTLTKVNTERWAPFARCKFGLDFHVYKRIGLQTSLDVLVADFGGIGLSAGIRF